eukprot:scaffold190582_cov20-Tisochrysis_lutea.AAC.2
MLCFVVIHGVDEQQQPEQLREHSLPFLPVHLLDKSDSCVSLCFSEFIRGRTTELRLAQENCFASEKLSVSFSMELLIHMGGNRHVWSLLHIFLPSPTAVFTTVMG